MCRASRGDLAHGVDQRRARRSCPEGPRVLVQRRAGPVETAAATDDAHGPQNTVVAGTNDIVVHVPIMGEGLRSARVVCAEQEARRRGEARRRAVRGRDRQGRLSDRGVVCRHFQGWKIKVDDTVLIGQPIALVTGDAASVAGLPVERRRRGTQGRRRRRPPDPSRPPGRPAAPASATPSASHERQRPSARFAPGHHEAPRCRRPRHHADGCPLGRPARAREEGESSRHGKAALPRPRP
jgi:hypothetical protein